MDYTECKDIYDFYEKTGMNRQQAFVFLLAELNKLKGGNNEEEERRSKTEI